MKRQFFHMSRNSIGFKLITGVYIILLPLITILIFNNYYAIDVIHNQVAESYTKLMSLYMNQIDQGLRDGDKYINKLLGLDNDFTIMEYTNNRDEFILSKANLSRRMNEDILMYKTIDFFFVYSERKDETIEAFNENSSSYAQRVKLRAYIKEIMKSNISADQLTAKDWYAQKIDGEYYLFRIMRVNDTYVGAWVKPSNLLMPLSLINIGEKGASLLVTNQGVPIASSGTLNYKAINFRGNLDTYYETGDKKQYIAVGKQSSVGDFRLMAIIPNKNILESLPVLQRMGIVIAVVILMILPLFFLFLRTTILVPIKRMLRAMKLVREGNFDGNMDFHATSDEFKTVNETFNKMVSEIKELRINVYEEQLSKQKAELQHLQLQVKPHFFLNSLNIIYSLAQVQNYKLIQELTLCLVNYFRYMFKSNLSFVELKSEMEHVRNYIRIQELRYPNSLEYSIDVPEELYTVQVPQLIIQTFLENTVKHAVTLDDPVRVEIKAEAIHDAGRPWVKISIRDNGRGFPEEVLEKISQGERIVDEQGEHIGIWNARRRIGLLYGKDASITFGNSKETRGAVIEMMLPL